MQGGVTSSYNSTAEFELAVIIVCIVVVNLINQSDVALMCNVII